MTKFEWPAEATKTGLELAAERAVADRRRVERAAENAFVERRLVDHFHDEEYVTRTLAEQRGTLAAIPPDTYKPLSAAAKAAIVGDAQRFAHRDRPARPAATGVHGSLEPVAWPPEVVPGRPRYYHPVDGRFLGYADFFPVQTMVDPVARPEWYVQIAEGWTSLDLSGVRWANRQATRYGVHDDGAVSGEGLIYPDPGWEPPVVHVPAPSPRVPSGRVVGHLAPNMIITRLEV